MLEQEVEAPHGGMEMDRENCAKGSEARGNRV